MKPTKKQIFDKCLKVMASCPDVAATKSWIAIFEVSNNKGRTLTFQDDLLMIFELGYEPKVIRDVGDFTINDKAFEKFFKLKLTKIKS